MTAPELLTRISIWLSVACWAWVIVHQIRRKAGRRELWVGALGAACFGVHTLTAFGAFYDWSHAVALRETSRQTFEATGFDSGAGLWLNYLFGVVWIVDVLVGWRWSGGKLRPRPRIVSWLVHGFMAFMIFNGTVVFGHGPVVVFGAMVFLWIAVELVRRRAGR